MTTAISMPSLFPAFDPTRPGEMWRGQRRTFSGFSPMQRGIIATQARPVPRGVGWRVWLARVVIVAVILAAALAFVFLPFAL